MEELKNELESAYKMISSLTVSGDSVDIVAVVRSKLRNVYAMIDELPTVEEKPEETKETEEV